MLLARNNRLLAYKKGLAEALHDEGYSYRNIAMLLTNKGYPTAKSTVFDWIQEKKARERENRLLETQVKPKGHRPCSIGESTGKKMIQALRTNRSLSARDLCRDEEINHK